tara:strand:+ start:918 stop:1109 length:192 start_codon:yes stop_codon:yes gene_type:complete
MDEIKREENLMRADIEKTILKKEQFIREIRGGLGERIKENGNKIKKINQSPLKRLWGFIKKIF